MYITSTYDQSSLSVQVTICVDLPRIIDKHATAFHEIRHADHGMIGVHMVYIPCASSLSMEHQQCVGSIHAYVKGALSDFMAYRVIISSNGLLHVPNLYSCSFVLNSATLYNSWHNSYFAYET